MKRLSKQDEELFNQIHARLERMLTEPRTDFERDVLHMIGILSVLVLPEEEREAGYQVRDGLRALQPEGSKQVN